MGTVVQEKPQINPGSQPRWDRFECGDLFEQYRELRTQGVSERQVAKALNVPRTTLQAWRQWHDTLDICPHVAEFFQSGPGLAFLHRLGCCWLIPIRSVQGLQTVTDAFELWVYPNGTDAVINPFIIIWLSDFPVSVFRSKYNIIAIDKCRVRQI
jgi:hypothetical protein